MNKNTHQEEHALLITFPRQLLQTPLPQELSPRLHQVVNTHKVSLKLHQFD